MVGGKSDSVGVVHGSKESVTPRAPVVGDTAPARRRSYQSFPWESRLKFDIPWEARTYTFQWTNGGVTVLPEEWTIDRDSKGRVLQIHKAPTAHANALGFPEIDYATAKKMQDISSKRGVSLKVAFALSYTKMESLSAEVKEKIALAPEQFAHPDKAPAAQVKAKEVAEAYWAAVNANASTTMEAELNAVPKG